MGDSASSVRDQQHRITAIALAIGIGVWVPIRLLFFEGAGPADFVLDTVALAAGLFSILRLRPTSINEFFINFWPDLLVALPFDFAARPFLGFHAKRLLLLKLFSLRHVFSIRKVFDAIDSLHPVLARLLPLAFIMPMVVHLIACGWIELGSGTAGPSDDKVFEYGRAVYWAITTLCTVGYGDISSKTLPQMAYASTVMIVGVAFFGYVLSNVAALLARMDAAKEHHSAILDRVEAFMRYNKAPPELRGKVRAYYRYLWESRRGYDDSFVLSSLPQKLRSEVSLYLNEEIINKVPILKGADKEMLEDIVLEFRSIVALPDEKIFRHGELGEAMYFIQRGSVEIVKDDKVLATLTDGAFFGETALLTSSPRNATARATGYCDLHVLDRSCFEKVLARYPKFKHQVQEIVKSRNSQAA